MFSKNFWIITFIFILLIAVGAAAYTYYLINRSVLVPEEVQYPPLPPSEGAAWQYDSVRLTEREGGIAYSAVFMVFLDQRAKLYTDMTKQILTRNENILRNNDTVKFNVAKEIDGSKSLQEYFQREGRAFINFCKSIQDKLEDSAGKGVILPCERVVELRMTQPASNLTAVKVRSYDYLGGASGYTSINSYNVRMSADGYTILTLGDIVPAPKMALFRKIAEQQFRLKFNVPNDNLNEAGGFNFPNASFSLPSRAYSFSFQPQGLEFVYAPDEIASASDGFIAFIVPYTLLYNVISPDFLLSNTKK